jgi:GT2 family glycosyltransferase
MADNGSGDDSIDFVSRQFPTVRILSGKQNRGFAAGNNWAARAATGKYLAFLNNDMRVDPSWLKELVKALDPGSGALCVAGKILSWDGHQIDFNGGYLNFYGMAFQQDQGRPENHVTNQTSREILYPCGGSMLIDRELFLNVGMFDEDYFAYFEDVDLGWRLWVMGWRVVFSPKAVTYHRYQGTSSQIPPERRTLLYERNALFSIIKNYDDRNLSLILPVALLLTAHRGFLATQETREAYLMPSQGGNPVPPLSSKVRESKEGPFLGRKTKDYIRKSCQLVRKEGIAKFFTALCYKTADRLKATRQGRLFSNNHESSRALVSRTSLSYFAALDEVARRLPQTLQKRAFVQSRRRRDDTEILSLFGTPFHPHPPRTDYFSVQQALSACLSLKSLFPVEDRDTMAFDPPF